MNGFTWPVAVKGYEWRDMIPEPVLRAVKPGLVRYFEPMDRDHTGLFRAFAEIELTKDGIRSFANQYGQLGAAVEILHGREGPMATLPIQAMEHLSEWQDQIGRMREALGLWELVRSGEGGQEEVESLRETLNRHLLHHVSVHMVQDIRHGGLSLRKWPVSLLGALWLQLAEAVSGNKEFRSCPTCGKWFELSPDVARTNRLFCSDKCRTRAYRGRKEQAQKLAKKGKSIKEIAKELDSDVKTVKGWIQSQQQGK
jgi:hypothetical protein